jgi:hypothetical protein
MTVALHGESAVRRRRAHKALINIDDPLSHEMLLELFRLRRDMSGSAKPPLGVAPPAPQV